MFSVLVHFVLLLCFCAVHQSVRLLYL